MTTAKEEAKTARLVTPNPETTECRSDAEGGVALLSAGTIRVA